MYICRLPGLQKKPTCIDPICSLLMIRKHLRLWSSELKVSFNTLIDTSAFNASLTLLREDLMFYHNILQEAFSLKSSLDFGSPLGRPVHNIFQDTCRDEAVLPTTNKFHHSVMPYDLHL